MDRTTTAAAPPVPAPRALGPGARLAFAGAVAVGAAIAIGELLAGLLPGVPSPLLAVARFIVDVQPPGAKDLVVSLFGEADKLAFQIFILLVALAVGGALGRLAPVRPAVASGLLAAFAASGFLASLRDPNNVAVLSAGVAAAEVVVGVRLLGWLTGIATQAGADARGGVAARMPDWSRRSLLRTGGALALGSLVAGTVGRLLLERQRNPQIADEAPSAPVAAELPPGADLATADLAAGGLTPIVVPNDEFYRIDTAFIPPNVDRASWRLTVTGLVDREVELTYDELVALPIIEQYVTIACVSNTVGGDLVGNAKWTGVALRDVLGMAGVQGMADQLVGRSVDGFTAGMPVEWVMDESRTPMIAVAMNDQPLPRAHGYPARLIIPGLFGYVSATKWLSNLELTTFDRFKGYWIPLGWAARAPILTQSRIDVPRFGAPLEAGTIPVAGVAWAPDRGIDRVEVRVDDGEWQGTRLSAPISDATWVQWLYLWEAGPGTHTIEVRAVDGNGEVQTEERSNPAPDGARGHHRVTYRVA